MGALFGKSKKHESRVTEQDRAVLQLKQQRDKLKQYQKKIGIQLEKERQIAKQLLKDGLKDKAKSLLRKKRFQESLLEKTDKQLDGIDQMVTDLEFSQIESKVLQGLKQGNEALNKMHQLMSLEDVEKIMEETQEGIEYQREIDEMLSGSLTEEDELNVLAELDALSAVELPSVPEILLPSVPENLPEKGRSTDQKQAVMAS
ncbi:charged multivesicular body protein 6-B-like [Tubulanus polymorphus]|uniref:charged multivesicular body protein 6-B-like n=1 Tax=Tubulanus polymorphus TaxID=672921 RepID=UPI003DA1E70C